jgi:hypothetical protein
VLDNNGSMDDLFKQINDLASSHLVAKASLTS